jgi:GDP-L-fucose synthase
MTKILVTGGTGMVGTALQEVLKDAVFLSSKDANLVRQEEAERVFQEIRPEKVIHLAARVGGVKANMDNLGLFFYENLMINTNVLECCRKTGVEKVLSLLSTCVYPDIAEYPLKEEVMHTGPPHPTNYGYAYAKRMLEVQTRTYREQYGCKYTTAIPNNLFGENDYFDLENSHVIPAMIRKIYEAREQGEDVRLWGDGNVYREFTYSKDMARILEFLLDKYDEPNPINIGNTNEYKIKDVANIIANIFNFENNIVWDTTKPKGQLKKPSDGSKLKDIGWDQYTDFSIALANTCDWFENNYSKIRGK